MKLPKYTLAYNTREQLESVNAGEREHNIVIDMLFNGLFVPFADKNRRHKSATFEA